MTHSRIHPINAKYAKAHTVGTELVLQVFNLKSHKNKAPFAQVG